MGAASAILLVLITIILPPLGVYAIAGCGMDLFVNICLTVLGYFPGHLHAFYLEYIYYDRREQTKNGMPPHVRAPGVYSDRVQSGGYGYGTIVQPTGTHQGVTTKGIDWPGDGSGYAVMDTGQANSYYHGTGQMGDAMGDDE